MSIVSYVRSFVTAYVLAMVFSPLSFAGFGKIIYRSATPTTPGIADQIQSVRLVNGSKGLSKIQVTAQSGRVTFITPKSSAELNQWFHELNINEHSVNVESCEKSVAAQKDPKFCGPISTEISKSFLSEQEGFLNEIKKSKKSYQTPVLSCEQPYAVCSNPDFNAVPAATEIVSDSVELGNPPEQQEVSGDLNPVQYQSPSYAGVWKVKTTAIKVSPVVVERIVEKIVYQEDGQGRTGVTGCFSAGTLVRTEAGTKEIEKITKGMKVYSFDERKGRLFLSSVIKTYHRSVKKWVVVELVDGTKITATEGHLFYNPESKKYVQAKDLKDQDPLLKFTSFEEQKSATVQVKSIEKKSGKLDVYDLNIDPNHNYFVTDILVHNKNS